MRQPWSRTEGLDRRSLLQSCLVYRIVSVQTCSLTIWFPSWLLLHLTTQRKLWRWWYLPLWTRFGLATLELLWLQLWFRIRVAQSSSQLAYRFGGARSEGLFGEHLYFPAACPHYLHLVLWWGHAKPLLFHVQRSLLALLLHGLHVDRSVWLGFFI